MRAYLEGKRRLLVQVRNAVAAIFSFLTEEDRGE